MKRVPETLKSEGVCQLQLFENEAGITKLLLPLAQQQQEGIALRRSVDPSCATIEAIWAPAHKQDQLSVAEIAQRVNTLLFSRGEKLEYSAKETGWRLSDIGLTRRRTAKGMVVKFSAEVRHQVHVLARQFRLTLRKVDGCEDCSPVQVTER